MGKKQFSPPVVVYGNPVYQNFAPRDKLISTKLDTGGTGEPPAFVKLRRGRQSAPAFAKAMARQVEKSRVLKAQTSLNFYIKIILF